MRNDTNKRNLFLAIGLGLLFILIPIELSSIKNLVVNEDFIISLVIYSVLSYIALYAYGTNKIVGILLLVSISLISNNLFKNFKGELYPITYVIFTSYFSYYFGIRIFKKWKSSL